MARNRSSRPNVMLMVFLLVGAAVAGVYFFDGKVNDWRVEQQEEYHRQFLEERARDYDLVTATVLEKSSHEYDTGDWEYDDEGDTHWETYHITEYTYTIEYDYNGEHRTQTFTNREDYPGPGSTMQIYVDKLFGEFPGDRDFVEE